MVSDERRLMALLSEGNPATDVAQAASLEVSAATYLATLERRSGDMTTYDSAKTQAPSPRRGLAWAVAALTVVLALGGLYFAFSGDDGQVVDQITVPAPTTVPVPEPELTPLVKWPQSSLEEVREAQELADAGDPNYTWQLEANMASILIGTEPVETPEILARFLREELGWEEFALVAIPGNSAESGGIRADGVQFIRCEPGKENPVWPDDSRFGGCAPTIDDFHYETVEVYVAQPGRRGPEGIWVASTWGEVDPFEQVAPLTDVEIAAIVEPFLQARIAGEGAEEYLGDLSAGDWLSSGYLAPGFLYATSTGAPYERADFDVVDGGEWPDGSIRVKVRLFAEAGQTVVEQTFSSGRGGAFYHHKDDLSTENGQPLPKT